MRVTRRGWLVIGLVGALAFLGGIGLFKLLVGDDDGSADRLAVTGTPTAEPTDVPTDQPTDEPSPTPMPVVTPRATSTAAPSLTPAATATPQPTPTRTVSPTPRPTTKSPTPKPTTKSPTPSPTPRPTHTLLIQAGNSFSPTPMTIALGDAVKAVYNDSTGISHTFTRKTGAGQQWDSGSMSAGSTYTVVFGSAGTYDYVCSFHQSSGMTGRIIVQ